MPDIFILLFSLLIPLYHVEALDNSSKYIGNPIFSPDANAWDNTGVVAPYVIFSNGLFKMWYAGIDSSHSQIGYAESPDGINNWVRLSHPVVTTDINKYVSEPNVLFNGSSYEMWFTFTPPYEIRHATSSNGINWTVDSLPVITPEQSWESAAVAGPWVIKDQNGYKMWYLGNNGSYWQIGYAESTNGTNWTKLVNNPVLVPEGSEIPTVGKPTVIFENGHYVMFYHAAHPPNKINMATSPNGINWTKYSSNPVLTTSSSGFDSHMITGPSLLKIQNAYMLWYNGFNGTYWSIGLATSSALPGTPPPTPTPTPTSIPPTPTPIPVKKVIVVPGIGASWNSDAIYNCKSDNYSGNWTLAPYAESSYQPVLEALSSAGYETLPLYYDWRKLIPGNAALITNLINENTIAGEKVNLVGHSMGGLLGRAYLEEVGQNHKLNKLLTVASPHRGAVLIYPIWSAGELPKMDLTQRIALTILLRRCGLFKNNREIVQNYIPSIQNLLPTFDYLRDKSTNLLKPVSGMSAKNNWLPTDFLPPFFGVTVGTLNGTGFNTLNYFLVKDPGKPALKLGNWLDGKPIDRQFSTTGDDTVLVSSATIPGADNRQISQNHTNIIKSSQGIDQILNFLGETTGEITKIPKVDQPKETQSALVFVSTDANFWMQNPDGSKVKDTDGIIAIINPQKGKYKFNYFPKKRMTQFSIGQFLANGQVLWRDYEHQTILPKFRSFDFDVNFPKEDILN